MVLLHLLKKVKSSFSVFHFFSPAEIISTERDYRAQVVKHSPLGSSEVVAETDPLLLKIKTP